MTRDDFYKAIQEAYHMEAEATVIKVPFDDVKEITLEAIFYKRGYSDTKKIDLNECARNFYLAQGISPNEKNGGLKCVGGRRFAFFEFFTTEHHTRIYIPLKKTVFTRFLQKIGLDPYAKERSEFFAFQKRLNAAGFTTLDLT